MLLFAALLPWIVIVPGAWLLSQLLRQNGRLLLRIEALENAVTQIGDEMESGASATGNRPLTESKIARDGLSAGSDAQDFRLPTLDGGELSLSDYRGKRVCLVFSDPSCAPCQALMPELENIHRQSGDIQLVLISRGDVAENRRKARVHRLTFPIALQRSWEISKLYAMFTTPIAYLIDEEGRIVSDVAIGAPAILHQLSNTHHSAEQPIAVT